MSWEPDDTPVYQSVAQRRAKAQQRAAEFAEEHGPLTPVAARSRKIASTFWGQAWNRNLERYEEYEHRLPRGRSVLKNEQVIDLKAGHGCITALVSGEELYEVAINIRPLDAERWQTLKNRCAGQIQSLVALLQGKLPESVMAAVTDRLEGLFPEPSEIRFICTCPDYADLCEHAAAAAYGVSVRLDEEPALLFLLRGVDHSELVNEAGAAIAAQADKACAAQDLEFEDLSGLFGIDLDTGDNPGLSQGQGFQD